MFISEVIGPHVTLVFRSRGVETRCSAQEGPGKKCSLLKWILRIFLHATQPFVAISIHLSLQYEPA